MRVTHATEVAGSVHRLGTKWVKCFLIDDGGVTVVDSGFPGYFEQLPATLGSIGRSLGDVVALVLTHYHPDHVGSAERIRAESGAIVYAPEREAAAIRGDAKVPLPGGLVANLWRPGLARYLAHAVASGGMRKIRPVTELRTYSDGDVLDVPGGLRVVHTPGHSAGHCSLLDEARGALFAGDALGTVSFASGRLGPQPPMVNEDRAQALASLSRLERLPADVLLCGHGEPHRGPLADAIAQARAPMD